MSQLIKFIRNPGKYASTYFVVTDRITYFAYEHESGKTTVHCEGWKDSFQVAGDYTEQIALALNHIKPDVLEIPILKNTVKED